MSMNVPSGQMDEQYTRPNREVIRITTKNPIVVKEKTVKKLSKEGMNCRKSISSEKRSVNSPLNSTKSREVTKKKKIDTMTRSFLSLSKRSFYNIILFIANDSRSIVPTPISCAYFMWSI